MGMHDVAAGSRDDGAAGDIARRPRLSAAKRRQLSGQSAPVGTAIGTARPVEEMRRIEHEEVEPGKLAGDQPRRPVEADRIIR